MLRNLKALVWLAAPLLLLAACSSDERLPLDPVETSLPETTVSATRLGIDGNGVQYHFLFESSNASARFEYQLGESIEAGAANKGAALSGWLAVDGAELTLQVDFPLAGNSRTLFARAVDRSGRVDATPARVTFDERSIAPVVTIVSPLPVASITCQPVSRVVNVAWDVHDPDNSRGDLETRFIVLERSVSEPCLVLSEYESEQPIASIKPNDPRWSDWVVFDPQADEFDPSRGVRVDGLPLGSNWIIGVQARDGFGTTGSSFEWGSSARHFITSDGRFPLLVVQEPLLGTHAFVGTAGLKSFDVAQGIELEFSWTADASEYGGRIEGYQWGLDVVDPEDPHDPGWQGPWSIDAISASFALQHGSHNLIIQVLDDSGVLSRGTFQLQAIPVTPFSDRRGLLFVYDYPFVESTEGLAFFEASLQQWVGLLESTVEGFQPTDVIVAQQAPERLSLRSLLDYRSVVWFTNASESTFLHSRLAPVSSSVSRLNWLEQYQREGGNLLVAGPGAALGMLHRDPPPWEFPILLDPAFPESPANGPGTPSWPWAGWCLSTVDIVRPAFGQIWGEFPGELMRTYDCDGLAWADVAPEFAAANPAAALALVNLAPTQDRVDGNPLYQLRFEEFYDTNVSGRQFPVTPRDCQKPMFVHRARVDAGLADPSPCGDSSSELTGAPVAIESSVYSDSKHIEGSHDFLWGFHPLAFEELGVRVALRWILIEDWGLVGAGE